MAQDEVLAVARPIGHDLEAFGKRQRARCAESVGRRCAQLIGRWRHQKRVIDVIVSKPVSSEHWLSLCLASQFETRSHKSLQVVDPERLASAINRVCDRAISVMCE
jgi:hypothetical protein